MQLGFGDAQLVLTANFVDRELASQCDFASILQKSAIDEQLAAKDDAAQLSVGVFESKIHMAGALDSKVGNFAGNPDLPNLALKNATDLRSDLRD